MGSSYIIWSQEPPFSELPEGTVRYKINGYFIDWTGDGQPTEQWLNNELNKEKLISCKDKAKQLIASSDWSVLPDISIANKSEFELYRTQLRNLIINPVEDPIFPIEPNPIWSE